MEPKAHALRSVGGAAQLVTSPFPGHYGGSEKCGVHEEDEADEVLMAICGACALSVRVILISTMLITRMMGDRIADKTG